MKTPSLSEAKAFLRVDGEQDDTISAFVRKKANSETEYTIVLDGKRGLRLIIR